MAHSDDSNVLLKTGDPNTTGTVQSLALSRTTPTTPDITKAAASTGAGLTQTGQQLLSGASDVLSPYISKLSAIFGGDRTQALEAAGPEVATVSDQFDAAYKAAQNNMPRGGGRNATLNNLQFQKADAIQTTLNQERQAAGKELGAVGLNLAQLGTSSEEAGAQSFQNILSSLLGKDISDNQVTSSALGSIGETIGMIALAFA